MYLFELPSWATGFNLLVAAFSTLCVIGGAIVVILLRGKSEVSGIQLDRATAAEALAKIRSEELTQLKAEKAKVEEELEDVTSEYRTLSGLVLAELFGYWEQKEDKEAQMADLQRKIRILEKRKDGDI